MSEQLADAVLTCLIAVTAGYIIGTLIIMGVFA